MAITDINLSGKVRQDDGDGLSGATVTILETSAALTGDAEGSAVTTDSNGTWSFTEQTLTETYDVKIASGSSVRYIAWSDEITLKTVDASVLKVRGVASAAAPIYLFADRADDAGDGWRIQASTSDTLAIGSDKASAGTIIDYLTITNGASAAASNTTILGQLTIGVNDTGADVKFFGATSGRYWLWDESADGVVQIGTLTVGVDGTGHDVKFFGATASAYMLWDESADDLVLAGAAGIDLAGDIDVDGTANLDAVDIDGAVQIDATFTSGVDGQGYDTKFFGDTSGAYILWDTSADKLLTAGGAVVDIVKDKLLIGGTAVTTTAAELNILDGVTSTAAELNILDGVTSTAAELNIVDGVTSTAAELNLVDGSSANSVVNSKAVIYGSSGELAGTLSTAAQANITSVGTLTDLTVSGTSTTIGTVTSGIWNAGAVTSSGDITASATGDRYLLVHSTNASIAGIELRRATTGDGNFDWFWEASGGKLLASFKGSGSKTLAWGLESNGDASFESHDALNIGAAGNDFGAATLDLASGYEIAGAGGLTISSASGNFDLSSAGDTIRLRLGGADKVILAASGLRMTADSAHGTTAGTNVLSIFNGTPPEGNLANGASFFCEGGEMKVLDSTDNETTLSPHDDDGQWVFHSQDGAGRVLHVHMEKLMRRLDEEYGGGYIEEFTEEIGA